MPGIGIQVTANVQSAVQGLQTLSQQLAANALSAARVSGALDAVGAALVPLQNNLRNFQNALRTATDPRQIAYLTRSINTLQEAIERVRQSNTGFVRGSQQAGNALMNLGRVAQDAPFGFIAIQNNLNPLLESFQRLQSESGSTIGSLKALGSSLIGAGGVGLALSLVSSLLVKYPDILSGMTKEQIAARDAIKAYNEEVAKEQGSLQTELTRISSLVQIARDYSESSTARTAAIKELQKEYPGYLQNINQENINSQATQKAIDNLTDALSRKAKVQAISNLLTKAEEDLYKAQNAPLEDNLSAWDQIVTLAKNFNDLGGSAFDGVKKATDNQSKSVTGLQGNISKLQEQLDTLMHGQAENNDFELLSPDKLKKTKEKIDQVAETLRKLAIDRDELAKNPLLSFDEKDNKAFDLISAAIIRLKELKVADSSPIIVKLRAEADEASIRVTMDKFHERLKKLGTTDVVQIPVEISTELRKGSGLADIVKKNLQELTKKDIPELGIYRLPTSLSDKLSKYIFDADKFKEGMDRAKNYIKDMTGFVKTTIDPIFSAVFDNIGKGSQTALMAVGQAIKGVITQLIRAAAEAAVLSLILNAIMPGSGGKFSFSAMFSQLSGVPKFAQGGIAYGPTVGLFGEAGPEAIVPLDKLPDIIAKSGAGVGGDTRLYAEIRGSNIYMSNERTKTSRKRIYGK